MGGYTCGLIPQRIRSEVVVCEGEVGWVFEPARIVFGRLAKGVVAAVYRLLEPFAVGLADCHVVVVWAIVSVVSAASAHHPGPFSHLAVQPCSSGGGPCCRQVY